MTMLAHLFIYMYIPEYHDNSLSFHQHTQSTITNTGQLYYTID